ncbi:MAG: hypothetical protein U1E28_05295 [Beijerinckiaceae bacterium]
MRRAHRKAHAIIWLCCALTIPLVLILGWRARPSDRLPEPMRLDVRDESRQ